MEEFPISQEHVVNEQVIRKYRAARVTEVRVIGADNTQLGLMHPIDALTQAMSASLDLIEVAPSAVPPVCKIADYGKLQYELKKNAKAKPTMRELKTLKLRPVTADHDLMVQVTKAQEFLAKRHSVKFTVQFRAREITHPDLGQRLLEKAVAALADHAEIDQPPRFEGKLLSVTFRPRAAAPEGRPSGAAKKETAAPVATN